MKTVVYIASPYTKGDVAANVRAQFVMAEKLAREILEDTFQHSTLIMSPKVTLWVTKREQG